MTLILKINPGAFVHFLGNWLLKVSNFGPWFIRGGPMQSHISVYPLVRLFVFTYLRDRPLVFSNFGPPTFGRKGSYKIAPVVS